MKYQSFSFGEASTRYSNRAEAHRRDRQKYAAVWRAYVRGIAVLIALKDGVLHGSYTFQKGIPSSIARDESYEYCPFLLSMQIAYKENVF